MNQILRLFSFVTILVFCVVATHLDPEWVRWLHDIPYGDKVAHAIGGFVLALAMSILIPSWRFRVGNYALPVGILIALAMLTLSEAVQYYLPRNCSFLDLAANYLGVLAYCAFHKVFHSNTLIPLGSSPGNQPE